MLASSFVGSDPKLPWPLSARVPAGPPIGPGLITNPSRFRMHTIQRSHLGYQPRLADYRRSLTEAVTLVAA